jgi:excinuclease ABC subunit B
MVILYANDMTDAIKNAIRETDRRRSKQVEYSKIHGITPQSIVKPIKDIAGQLESESGPDGRVISFEGINLRPDEVPEILESLRSEMLERAREMDFEKAAELRDEMRQLEDLLNQKASDYKVKKKKSKGKHRARQSL